MIALFITPRPPPEPAEAGFILAPWLTALPTAACDLLSILPVADVNGLTMAGIAASGCGAGAAASLMLADPFLRVRDAACVMSTHGIGRVANFPTVQLIDGQTARAFDSAGVGTRREIEMLAAFRSAGFQTVAFACGIEPARAMLRDGASTLVLHPGVALQDWRQRAAAALGIGRAMASLRQETDVPILVYRPAGFGSELDRAAAAADGEARIVTEPVAPAG